MAKKLVVLLTVVVLAGSAAKATMVTTIYPEEARAISGFHNGEGPFELFNTLSILKGTESSRRSVLEYDVSSLIGKQQPVTLNLWLDNIDEGSPEGIIDVFTFVGDGAVTADDFYAGGLTPFISFIGEDYFYRVTIDVTSLIQDILTADEKFIGFRLSTETTDRFGLGRAVNLPDPVLTYATPEPATLFLLGLGSLILCRKRVGCKNI